MALESTEPWPFFGSTRVDKARVMPCTAFRSHVRRCAEPHARRACSSSPTPRIASNPSLAPLASSISSWLRLKEVHRSGYPEYIRTREARSSGLAFSFCLVFFSQLLAHSFSVLAFWAIESFCRAKNFSLLSRKPTRSSGDLASSRVVNTNNGHSAALSFRMRSNTLQSSSSWFSCLLHLRSRGCTTRMPSALLAPIRRFASSNGLPTPYPGRSMKSRSCSASAGA
mmetsp:Transcript_60085/g.141778  ORF Transcript_60085/g.141778 Transcript_60085/m.141778 type:complete len:226 (-) Transcript_60085:1272-1949(-)